MLIIFVAASRNLAAALVAKIISWPQRKTTKSVAISSQTAMENASLSSDVWNDVTTSSPTDADDLTRYIVSIRDVAVKIVYIITGTVGVIDNLFVIIVFALFIKITDKVVMLLENLAK